MSILTPCAWAVALTLTIATVAQSQPVERPRPLLPERLALEQYARSLSIGTPPGVLRRQEPSRPVLVRSPETPASDNRVVPALPAAPALECPMPVMRPDTLSERAMPVVRVPGRTPWAGVIRGCENPLAAPR